MQKFSAAHSVYSQRVSHKKRGKGKAKAGTSSLKCTAAAARSAAAATQGSSNQGRALQWEADSGSMSQRRAGGLSPRQRFGGKLAAAAFRAGLSVVPVRLAHTPVTTGATYSCAAYLLQAVCAACSANWVALALARLPQTPHQRQQWSPRRQQQQWEMAWAATAGELRWRTTA